MELGDVPHTIKDRASDVTYVVMAYRELTRDELVRTVRMHQSQAKAKPKAGSRVTIFSSLGAQD